MAEERGIRRVEGANGKVRFQAQVWYDQKFITSRTFDSIALARKFKESKLEEAIRGTLLPAGARREKRKLEEDLDRPMQEWAARYIKANPGQHGENRLFEYDQVGRLLGARTMRDFSGKAGGKLIRQLADEWRFIRFVRGTRGEPFQAKEKPISDQTLRLRLSALDRVIVGADLNLSHRADPNLSQGRKPVLWSLAVDKFRSWSGSLASSALC